MNKKIGIVILSLMSVAATAQTLTPEMLWNLGRVSVLGLTKDGQTIVYKVSTPSVDANKSSSKYYTVPVSGGAATEVQNAEALVANRNVSPNGKYVLSSQETKVEKVLGKDFYPELEKSSAQVYNGLDYRHWDTWNDGTHNHVYFADAKDPKATPFDIMAGEPFDSPQKPHGGEEDYIWSPNNTIIYVCKKKAGTAYAISTNTDLYEYNIETKSTRNLTESNLGYDTNPAFSAQGVLAYLQMQRDGYEADKNDIIIRLNDQVKINLTAAWDGSVDNFMWAPDGKKIYFVAAIDGTKQLFEVNNPGLTKIAISTTNIV